MNPACKRERNTHSTLTLANFYCVFLALKFHTLNPQYSYKKTLILFSEDKYKRFDF